MEKKGRQQQILFSWAPKSQQMVTAALKRHLLLERKAMTNLDSVLESRDIILLTKILIVKAMVFPIVMYRCEDWTMKKAECRRIDDFELWCWRRLLRVPWTAKRSNQSILKEINPEYSLEGLMLKLNLLILWPPDTHSQLIGKDPDAGKDWGHEEKGTTEDQTVGWHHQLNEHELELREIVKERKAWCAAVHGIAKVGQTEWLNNNKTVVLT